MLNLERRRILYKRYELLSKLGYILSALGSLLLMGIAGRNDYESIYYIETPMKELILWSILAVLLIVSGLYMVRRGDMGKGKNESMKVK